MRTPRAAAALCLLLLLAGCSSLSDSLFLLRKLDDPAKSRALTDQGVELFELYIVGRGEYGRIEKVRGYFEVALRFDPTNGKAKVYLERVDGFRKAETGKNLAQAGGLLKKARRSREEDYALCLAASRAWELDPANEEVLRLRQETSALRQGLVAQLLEEALAAKARGQEGAFIEAFRSLNQALAIEPGNRRLREEADALRPSIDVIFAERLRKAERLSAEARFGEALREVDLLEELNLRLEHSFDRELAELNYALNLQWARSLYERREYSAAETRVAGALAVRKTDEAAALRRRILEARAKSESVSSFEAGLGEVDRLIAEGDLAGAYRRSERLAQGTREPARLASLEERQKRIRSQLPFLYQTAVDYYRAEEYRKAAELLQTVLAIDLEFEQAAEYLDKARTKQKLLEQYGGQP